MRNDRPAPVPAVAGGPLVGDGGCLLFVLVGGLMAVVTATPELHHVSLTYNRDRVNKLGGSA